MLGPQTVYVCICAYVCAGGGGGWGGRSLIPVLLVPFSLETEKLQAEGRRDEVHQCGRQLPDGARQEEPGAAERGESGLLLLHQAAVSRAWEPLGQLQELPRHNPGTKEPSLEIVRTQLPTGFQAVSGNWAPGLAASPTTLLPCLSGVDAH